MHAQTNSCEQLLCTYNHWQLMSLKFQSRENCFQTQAAGFVCLPYLVKEGEEVSERFTSYYSIETR